MTEAEGGAQNHPQAPATAPDRDARRSAQAEMLRRGVALLRAERISEAAEVLARAASGDPNDAEARFQLGVALQAAGRYEEARALFRGVRSALPDNPDLFLHAAVVEIALGDYAAALEAAEQACRLAPKLATAQYARGQADAALGRPEQAEFAFHAAARLQPTWGDAWVNVGVACYRQGRIGDAKAAMRRALAAEPGHAAALANLGAFMRITGETEEAERLLEGAVANSPDAYGARLNLAVDLIEEERPEEALKLLQEAEPPDDPIVMRHWRLQQISALMSLGRKDEAQVLLDALTRLGPMPPTLAPLLHWRLAVMALAAEDEAEALKEVEATEAALSKMGPRAVPEHAILTRFDLARFWSKREERARAFAHWTAGHELLKRFQPFSRERHRAFIDASVTALDKVRLRDGARASNTDPAPVFIVGMPRSGTTLMEQILAAHRDAFGAGERSALGRMADRLAGRRKDAASAAAIAALGADALNRAAEDYLSELHALAPEANRIVDKMPHNFLNLGLVGLMLSGARIIHCVRDPRDIGFSIFAHRFRGHHDYAHDLADLGWYIGEHDRLMAHWRAALPNRILSVRLNDWIDDFEATLARVLAHVDLPHDDDCARFYENDTKVKTASRWQVRQPINDRGIGRWIAYASQLAPMIAELEKAGSIDSWEALEAQGSIRE
jgi:tetratricopeptide (TPR) repeat protein